MLTGKLLSKPFKSISRSTSKCLYQTPKRLKRTFRYSSRKKFAQQHTKLALLGAVVSLSAIALPSPWSWVTFILGLQLFAPIVGLSFKLSRDAQRQRLIADIHKRLEVLDREILKGDPHETGLTTHNKRIEYNTLARLLERLSEED